MNKYESALAYTETGQVNDMFPEWYGEDERLWLSKDYSVTKDATIQDMWYEKLRAEGYTGTINDMLKDYWDAPSKRVVTLSGTQYGTLDSAYTASAGDTYEVKFATTSTGAVQHLTDGDIATDRAYIQFTAGDVIAWDPAEITAATLDGAAATNGVTAAPNDGKEHTIVATMAAGAKLYTVGVNYTLAAGLFEGQIFSLKIESGSTVVTNIVFDSGSTTEQYYRGSTTEKVTLVNFASSDWARYTLQRNIKHDAGTIALGWLGDDVVTNGTFDADTDWTKDASWTISGGVATHTSGVQDNILQDALTLGLPYLSTIDITRRVDGAALLFLGFGTSSPSYTTVGTKTFFGTAAGSTNIIIQGGSTADLDVDNASARHLIEVV